MSRRKPDIEATEPNFSSSGSSKSDLGAAQHHEHAGTAQPRKASVAAKLRNPLAGYSEEQVIADVDAWCVEKGLQEHQEEFRKGALIARVGQRDDGFEYVNQLSTEEKDWLRHEVNHRWSQPFMLYFLVVLCAGSAIVQGMDQTAVNGAQVSRFAVSIPSRPATDSFFRSFTLKNSISERTKSGFKVYSTVLLTSALVSSAVGPMHL
jgi:hypothetical protein